jgi:hypothetical protein
MLLIEVLSEKQKELLLIANLPVPTLTLRGICLNFSQGVVPTDASDRMSDQEI